MEAALAERGEKGDKCDTKGSGNAGWEEREYEETEVQMERKWREKYGRLAVNA